LTCTMTRRSFSTTLAAATSWMAANWRNVASAENAAPAQSSIDRYALVKRHNVVQTAADIASPLSVGNGEFAFTADITGLQTFTSDYAKGMPLATVEQWGFRSAPPKGFSLGKFPLTYLDTSGRQVGYLYCEKGKSSADLGPAADYL